MKQIESDFFIEEEEAFEAWAALRGLVRTHELLYIDSGSVIEAVTFGDAMEECGWVIARNRFGDVFQIKFIGNKLGSDDLLWEKLAPFIREDSYITMENHNALWSWVFDGVKVSKKMVQYKQ